MSRFPEPTEPGFYYLSPAGWVGPHTYRSDAVAAGKPYGFSGIVRHFPRPQDPEPENLDGIVDEDPADGEFVDGEFFTREELEMRVPPFRVPPDDPDEEEDLNEVALRRFPPGTRVKVNDEVLNKISGERKDGRRWSDVHGIGVVRKGLDRNKDPGKYRHQSRAGGAVVVDWVDMPAPLNMAVVLVEQIVKA